MINIIIPKSKAEIEQQIYALKWQIAYDRNEKDKKIHKKVLKTLELKLLKCYNQEVEK